MKATFYYNGYGDPQANLTFSDRAELVEKMSNLTLVCDGKNLWDYWLEHLPAVVNKGAIVVPKARIEFTEEPVIGTLFDLEEAIAAKAKHLPWCDRDTLTYFTNDRARKSIVALNFGQGCYVKFHLSFAEYLKNPEEYTASVLNLIETEFARKVESGLLKHLAQL